MSLHKLTPDDFDYFALETHPKRVYKSEFGLPVSGAAFVYARRSNFIKDIQESSLVLSDIFDDDSIENIRNLATFNTSSNIEGAMSSYLDGVRSKSVAERQNKQKTINRTTPPFDDNWEFGIKRLITKHLNPYHRVSQPSANWAFTNYNCINFFHYSSSFSGSIFAETPEDAVLLYPNILSGSAGNAQYQISGAFAFDFWIKPKYTVDEGMGYKAGSIMHLTGAYCLSLHSGSSVDQNGKPDKFRVVLQLREDANVAPSLLDLNLTSNAGGFTIATTDNSIPINEWSHVTFTWRGFESPHGSGSVFINGNLDSTFNIDSMLSLGNYTSGDPSVLCVGNYYEGDNTGTNALDRFFGNDTAEREGLYELNSGTGFFAPSSFDFTHKLQAEFHDLKLYNRHLPQVESEYLTSHPVSSSWGLQFYLPPFFTKESPFRKSHGGFGGVLVSPFYAKDQTTTTPFANEFAFACGGLYTNLENYVRDFATGNYARLWALTGSAATPPSSEEREANEIIFEDGNNVLRQFLIQPCDNGNIVPNFPLFLRGLSNERFRNDLGNVDYGLVSLNNIVSESQYRASKAIATSGSILDDVLGASDANMAAVPGSSLAIAHRTQDTSSNFVVIFDISDLFYGMKIRPGSFVLKDPFELSAISTNIIRDDGKGNLYRADASNPHPSWASIGNIFYDEGIVVIKHPSLFFYGSQMYDMEFQGVQNVHIMTINAMARSMMETSSSNPSYIPQPPDNLANNEDKDFVYITGVNIHDDNLNVIMRTHIAQPIVKRTGDKILIRLKMDF